VTGATSAVAAVNAAGTGSLSLFVVATLNVSSEGLAVAPVVNGCASVPSVTSSPVEVPPVTDEMLPEGDVAVAVELDVGAEDPVVFDDEG
jgi:hypothetical protein